MLQASAPTHAGSPEPPITRTVSEGIPAATKLILRLKINYGARSAGVRELYTADTSSLTHAPPPPGSGGKHQKNTELHAHHSQSTGVEGGGGREESVRQLGVVIPPGGAAVHSGRSYYSVRLAYVNTEALTHARTCTYLQTYTFKHFQTCECLHTFANALSFTLFFIHESVFIIFSISHADILYLFIAGFRCFPPL